MLGKYDGMLYADNFSRYSLLEQISRVTRPITIWTYSDFKQLASHV